MTRKSQLLDRNTYIEQIHDYNINVDKRIIYTHSEDFGDYGSSECEESGVDFYMAAKFIKNLDFLNSISDEPILVKTLNCGGDWFYGMAMFDAIKKSVAPVDIHARAWARSMSSIIIQAGRKRILSPHSVFMIHYGSYGDYGDFVKVKSGFDFYQSLNKTMFDIYATRCYGAKGWQGMYVDDIAKAIEIKVRDKTDWWLTSEEALYYGFIDEID